MRRALEILGKATDLEFLSSTKKEEHSVRNVVPARAEKVDADHLPAAVTHSGLLNSQRSFWIFDTAGDEPGQAPEGYCDAEDLVLFFHPLDVPTETQLFLVGACSAMKMFAHNFVDRPADKDAVAEMNKRQPHNPLEPSVSVLTLYQTKLALRRVGTITLVLSGVCSEQDDALLHHLDAIFRAFVFYHGSFQRVLELCQFDRARYVSRMRQYCLELTPLIALPNYDLVGSFDGVQSQFQPTTYTDIPKSHHDIRTASETLLASAEDLPWVLAGCMTHGKSVLVSHLDLASTRWTLNRIEFLRGVTDTDPVPDSADTAAASANGDDDTNDDDDNGEDGSDSDSRARKASKRVRTKAQARVSAWDYIMGTTPRPKIKVERQDLSARDDPPPTPATGESSTSEHTRQESDVDGVGTDNGLGERVEVPAPGTTRSTACIIRPGKDMAQFVPVYLSPSQLARLRRGSTADPASDGETSDDDEDTDLTRVAVGMYVHQLEHISFAVMVELGALYDSDKINQLRTLTHALLLEMQSNIDATVSESDDTLPVFLYHSLPLPLSEAPSRSVQAAAAPRSARRESHRSTTSNADDSDNDTDDSDRVLMRAPVARAPQYEARASGLYIWGCRPSALASAPEEPDHWVLHTPLVRELRHAPVTSVTAGGKLAAALTANGDLYIWGLRVDGDLTPDVVGNPEARRATDDDTGLADSTAANTGSAPILAPLNGQQVEIVACGGAHILAQTVFGDVIVWGDNHDGQLGLGHRRAVDKPTPLPGLRHVCQLATGGSHSIAVTETGEVMTWGSNSHGQLGHGTRKDALSPKQVTDIQSGKTVDRGAHMRGLGLLHVAQVACGLAHSAVVSALGVAYTWGAGDDGQLGHTDRANQLTPRPVEALDGKWVTQVACGNYHTAALTADSEVYTWGWGKYGQLGHGDCTGLSTPTRVAFPSKPDGESYQFCQIACGANHTLVVTTCGQVFTFGWAKFGQLCLGDTENCLRPTLVPALRSGHIMDVACGWGCTMVLVSDDGFHATTSGHEASTET